MEDSDDEEEEDDDETGTLQIGYLKFKYLEFDTHMSPLTN
jgi:hypothetical protein